MKSIRSCNIDTKGRVVQGVGPLRGWCFLRACGLKTRL